MLSLNSSGGLKATHEVPFILISEIKISARRPDKARSFELRAATSLARLWREQGRRGEARDLLTPLYGSFTEGFDSADLIDAKRLLDELA